VVDERCIAIASPNASFSDDAIDTRLCTQMHRRGTTKKQNISWNTSHELLSMHELEHTAIYFFEHIL